jgi:hypothetical protein
MSNPVKELAKTCEIIGKECDDLVEQRRGKKIGDLRFVNEYFQLLDKLKDVNKKEDILKKLEDYAKQNLKKDKLEWLKSTP